MKRRITSILSITAALILLSCLAYAVDRKKQLKPVDRTPEATCEEETLKTELLAAAGEHHGKSPGVVNTKKIAGASPNVKIIANQHKKVIQQ